MKTKAYDIFTYLLLLFFLTNKAHGQPHKPVYSLGHGTTILVLITPDTIWVAADRKTTMSGSTHYIEHTKILQSESAFFAMSGVILIKDLIKNRIYFDAQNAMLKILKQQNDDIKISCEKYTDSIKKTLMASSLDTRIQFLRGFLNISVFDFVIIKGDKNGMDYIHRAIFIKGKPDSLIFTTRDEVNDIPNAIMFLGRHDYVNEYLTKNPNYLHGFKDIKGKLTCLIKIESDKSRYVGMPVDVLVLYKNKHKWYYKNNCSSME